MNSIIYIHRNKINGKCYVGQTTQSPHIRWGENGSNYIVKKKDGKFVHTKFAPAILKYGWDNFEHLVLSDIYKSQEELDAAEIATIAKYDSFNDGYNVALGGRGGHGKHSEETKRKLSKAHKGKTWYTNNELDGLYFEGEQPEGWFPGQSISRRATCSKVKKGKHNHACSEETKKKLSAANKGKIQPEWVKQKLRKKVVVIDTLNNTQTTYNCLDDAAKALNYSYSRCFDFKDKNKLLAKRFCIKSVSLKKDAVGDNN